MNAEQITGANAAQLLERAQRAQMPLEGMNPPEPKPEPPKPRRGRPPGSGRKSKPIKEPPPVAGAEAGADPALVEQQVLTEAANRAQFPYAAAELYFQLRHGYKGDAFKPDKERLERLVNLQRAAMRSVEAMTDGPAKRMLALFVGCESPDQMPVFVLVFMLVASHTAAISECAGKARAELEATRNSGSAGSGGAG
jgi:hypothetical protein